jgi:hypothetical protein
MCVFPSGPTTVRCAALAEVVPRKNKPATNIAAKIRFVLMVCSSMQSKADVARSLMLWITKQERCQSCEHLKNRGKSSL